MNPRIAKVLDRWAGGLALRGLAALYRLADSGAEDRRTVDVRAIAVVKFWGVGNAALLLPVVRSLKRRYATARLLVVTAAHNATLFRRVADDVFGVRLGPVPATLRDLVRATAALRRARIDLGLDFEQYVRTSQVLLKAAGTRQIYAFDTAGLRRAGLAHVKVAYDDSRHAAQSFLDLARAAGARDRVYRPGGLGVDPAAKTGVARLLEGLNSPPRPLVVLHPGSGDNFPGRRWPTRRFGLLGRRLAGEGAAAVVLTGSRRESGIASEVEEASGGIVRNLCGRLSLEELVALLDRSALVVSNDTGPVHLASALHRPVLGLYGPNTPRLYGPLSAGSAVFYDPPPCSPCITNFNAKTSRCLNPVCMRAIPVDAVAEEALARLRSARAGAGA